MFGIRLTPTVVTAASTTIYGLIILGQFLHQEWVKQPKLRIRHQPEENPDLYKSIKTVFMPRKDSDDNEKVETRREAYRIVVENRGKAVAKNCRAKLRILEQPDESKAPSAEPKSLHWSGLPPAENGDVPPKSSQLGLVDLVFTQEKLDQFEREDWGPTQARIHTQQATTRANTKDVSSEDGLVQGGYEFSIQIFPENGSPSDPAIFEVEIGGQQEVNEVSLKGTESTAINGFNRRTAKEYLPTN